MRAGARNSAAELELGAAAQADTRVDRESQDVRPWPHDGDASSTPPTAHEKRDLAVICAASVLLIFFVNAFLLWVSESLTPNNSFLDAFYFTIITATTIGYGDIVPTTTLGKFIVTVFIWVSIFFVTFSVSVVISWLEECADKLAKDDTKERSALRIRKDPKLALVKHMLMIIFLLAVGTIVYSSAEGWSFEDAVYYTSATLSTVGYGDLDVKSNASKAFTIAYGFVGVAMISGVVNKMQALIANADLIKKLDMWETITEEQIRAYDSDKNGGVSKAEFILAMLTETGFVDTDVVDVYAEKFDMFDLDKSGELTTEDIHEMIRQRAAKLAAAAVGP